MPATKLLANFKTAAQLNSQILPRVLKLNLNQMQQSPAVSLLLIAVHLFGTMAVLTGVSAETKETFNKSFQSLTEIGRLTSRPFTSVGVRPNWSSDQFTEGSFVVKTVSCCWKSRPYRGLVLLLISTTGKVKRTWKRSTCGGST